MLKFLGGPTSPDLAGLPQLPTLGPTPVAEAGPEVGLVDLDRPLLDAERLLLDVVDRPPHLEQEAVDPVIGNLGLAAGDAVIGEPELESEQKLVDLGQREAGVGEGRTRE